MIWASLGQWVNQRAEKCLAQVDSVYRKVGFLLDDVEESKIGVLSMPDPIGLGLKLTVKNLSNI